MLRLLESVPVAAAAHVTGGGISENLPRMLPGGTAAAVDLSAWEPPAVFRWLQEAGGIEPGEMLRTFNCGIGMVLAVDEVHADRAGTILRDQGETVFPIGRVVPGEGPPDIHYENPW